MYRSASLRSAALRCRMRRDPNVRVNLLPGANADVAILRATVADRRHNVPWMTWLSLIANDNDDPDMKSWEGYLESEDWYNELRPSEASRADSLLAKFVRIFRTEGFSAAEKFEERWYEAARRAAKRSV